MWVGKNNLCAGGMLSATIEYNVLQLELVRFWNTRLPKRLNRDTMFLCICKMKTTFAERP